MIVKKNFQALLLYCLMCNGILLAQKKALTPDDFDRWKHISGPQFSEDGNFLVYEYNDGNGDGSLVITDIRNGVSDTLERGGGARISGNSALVAFRIKPPFGLRRKAETEGWKGDKKPSDSLGIYLLESREVLKYPDVKDFSLPAEGGSWLAFKTITEIADPDGKKESDSLKAGKKQKKDTLVVVLNPLKKDSISFKNVKSYTWARKKNSLLFQSEKKDSTATWASVLRLDTATMQADTLFKGEGEVKKINLGPEGEKLAFLFSEDTTKIKKYTLYTGKGSAVSELKKGSIASLPDGWTPSENGSMFFSENGKRLFFGTARYQGERTRDTLLNSERAQVDIWAWTDSLLQPQQKVNLSRDRRKTFSAVYDFEAGKSLQLADSAVPEVTVLNKGDGAYVLAEDEKPYRRASSWNALWVKDIYTIDLNSGKRQLLVKAQNHVWMGPAQHYALYYNRKDSVYYSIDLKSNRHIPLTKELGVAFYDERNDTPSEPYPYGIAGWSEGDKAVYAYDRYDIWKLDPSGRKKPVRLTQNGREEKTVYRYLSLNRDEKYMGEDGKVWLSVFGEETKKAGYALADLKRNTSKVVMSGDYSLGRPVKAKNADRVFFSRETFREYPDLWITTTALDTPEKYTSANPQQKEYLWGNASLVEWKNYDNVPLQGLLYTPENMEPGRKYPMVVYYYERSSDTYHRHYAPTPSRSVINRTFYTSNDYLVFVPDIVYKEGYPGESAYNCIVSGVEKLMSEHSYIDSEHIALQGQSWGGYQTAYLVTQTDMFAAAMAGAPVSNMTSAYGGIRWQTGMSRMFQYEHTQSRIGGTLWEKRDLYIENSPLFFADKVNTPLLMMHNDNDGAVPWYQGIEYFVALRRLDKPVWMLTYNGEPHNLKGSSWGNRKDLSIRMMQFFDHYLKGKDAPEWMVKGRPALQKEYNKGY
ncbi:alpha/beta hydrolase family protein [Sinomicrobium soli]|uniref:alpha/beta hydrolase family protein n=1 Tax=Sinomicrobium sp. N-1-3-6 TaxID=2219864 RepID=UPI000DCE1A62|nr:prolyl oligopeptidase family serine peptidase [Sinomicrobium sp. N-1-3-6]RAV29637.1 S9 family peptidase [Sinomicrobium sp. N-1-3-6]